MTPRQAIELDLAPATVALFSGGLTRVTLEPALSYGILPRAEIELLAPFIFRERGATPSHGLTQFGLGAMYNFNNESTWLPAFAVRGEVAFPAAGATTTGTLFEGRAMATRTLGAFRVHANVTYSSYHVASAPAPAPGCTVNCPAPPPPIPDIPCGVVADDIGSQQTAPPAASSPTQSSGNVISAGLALDRTFPLASWLVVGDIVVSRYSGGPPRPDDWTLELGFRKQLSPRFVLDAGVGRLFSGLRPAWLVTLGTSYTFALPALVPEAKPGAH